MKEGRKTRLSKLCTQIFSIPFFSKIFSSSRFFFVSNEDTKLSVVESIISVGVKLGKCNLNLIFAQFFADSLKLLTCHKPISIFIHQFEKLFNGRLISHELLKCQSAVIVSVHGFKELVDLLFCKVD